MVEFLYKLSHASYFKWNTFLSYTLDQDSNYELPIYLAIWWSFVLSFVLFNFFYTTFLEITCPGECYKRKVLLKRFLAEESETTSLDVKEWGLLIHMRQMVVVLVSTVWGDFISRGGKPCKLGKSREAAIPNFSFSVLSKRRWLVLNDHMATERRKGQKLTSWVTFKTMSCCQNPCLRQRVRIHHLQNQYTFKARLKLLTWIKLMEKADAILKPTNFSLTQYCKLRSFK